MKTDLYTKTVLTVIALCLTVIVFKQLQIIPDAVAGIPGSKSPQSYGLVPVNTDGSINVHIKPGTETMNVSIVDVNTYDMLKVDVADINTSDKMNISLNDINTSDHLNVDLKTVDYSAFNNCIVPVKNK